MLIYVNSENTFKESYITLSLVIIALLYMASYPKTIIYSTASSICSITLFIIIIIINSIYSYI